MKYLPVEECDGCEGTGDEPSSVKQPTSHLPCTDCHGDGYIPTGEITTKAELLEEWGEKMWFLIDGDGDVQYFYEDEGFAKKMAEEQGHTCRPVHVVKGE